MYRLEYIQLLKSFLFNFLIGEIKKKISLALFIYNLFVCVCVFTMRYKLNNFIVQVIADVVIPNL